MSRTREQDKARGCSGSRFDGQTLTLDKITGRKASYTDGSFELLAGDKFILRMAKKENE